MNSITIIGHIGQDVQEKIIESSQKKYWILSLATSETWKNQQGEKQSRTTWHRCQLFGNYDGLVPYLRKGGQVAVVGTQRHEQYDKKDKSGNPVFVDGVQLKGQMSFIVVKNIELIGKKEDSQQAAPAPAATSQQPAQAQNDHPANNVGEDLPF